MPIADHIAQALCAALEYAPDRAAEVARLLTEPPNLALGDFAFPCFQLAKEQRAAPKAIAEKLAARIAPDALIQKAVAQGPYLNFYLNRPEAARRVIGEVLAQPETYGSRDLGRGQTVVVEFSSPNIAKPFHFGHLRSTNIGANLARMLSFMGYRIVRKNFIGDWGTQFGFVIYAWKKWGDEQKLRERAIDYLVELYVRANQESEKDAGVREQARTNFLLLEQGDPDISALWQKFRELSLAGFMKTYDRLRISFDTYDGEAAVNHLVLPVIQRFLRAGVAVHSEGAIVVEVADVLGPRDRAADAAEVRRRLDLRGARLRGGHRPLGNLRLRRQPLRRLAPGGPFRAALRGARQARAGRGLGRAVARALRERELRLRARHVHPQGRGGVARARARRGPRPCGARARGEGRRQPERLSGAAAGRARRDQRGRRPGGAALLRRLLAAHVGRHLRLGHGAAVRGQHRALSPVFPRAHVRDLPQGQRRWFPKWP